MSCVVLVSEWIVFVMPASVGDQLLIDVQVAVNSSYRSAVDK